MRHQPFFLDTTTPCWLLVAFFVFFVVTMMPPSSVSSAPLKYQLSTIAGVFSPGSSADGPVATTQINRPFFVVEAPNGDLFLSERFKIRRISGGNITTVAGIGSKGYSGDSGPATSAAINNPGGMAFVPATNELLFSDTGNNVLRLIDASGLISTVGGIGSGGFNGDGLSLKSTQLWNPEKLIFRNNTLYFVDKLNHRIRKVSFDSKVELVRTIAGNGNSTMSNNEEGIAATLASLDNPYEMEFDKASDDMFIADYGHNLIRKVSSSGMIWTVAGGGAKYQNNVLATQTTLNYPQSVVVSPTGDIFISDLNTIRKISKNGIITTICGQPGVTGLSQDTIDAANAQLNSPQSLFINKNGEVVFSDYYNNLVRKLTPYCSEGTVMSSDGTFCLEYCYRKLQNMTNVCSGNGFCVSTNSCACLTGFYGNECQFFTCFGKNASDVNVCSKHGSCSGLDNCTCEEGWMGSDCSIPVCVPIMNANQTVECSKKVISGSSMLLEHIGQVQNLDSKNISLSLEGSIFSKVQVIFPPSISKELSPYLNGTILSLVTSVYEQKNTTQTALKSPLISITILNSTSGDEVSIQQLQKGISLKIPMQNYLDFSNQNLTCMYFDVADQSWKKDGVTTIRDEVTMEFICITNHLTSFGVVDINGFG
ncbi:hypothetical protein C9374_001818 [Naegleria lovaniensis]|uniref:EGF-like domain-containing protein n=1 Tax=Naegleria lovaniensis TaxID=51637 RepID=A0AA88GX05_NAELO|nr:uncharacterized protein C9374_001818 [Naegleria lovaniensis]KAG2387486.1 hypothetical protein C9374_001818 [Naegleria lovaniensis]